MFDVAQSLIPGFSTADRELGESTALLARAQVSGGAGFDAAMARNARAVLFDEALLSAVRARLNEIETAAR
jgi:hypothetical protein